MVKLFVNGKTALATATVEVNLSLRSFNCFRAFWASNFVAKKLWLSSPRVSIVSSFSVMAVARHVFF